MTLVTATEAPAAPLIIEEASNAAFGVCAAAPNNDLLGELPPDRKDCFKSLSKSLCASLSCSYMRSSWSDYIKLRCFDSEAGELSLFSDTILKNNFINLSPYALN